MAFETIFCVKKPAFLTSFFQQRWIQSQRNLVRISSAFFPSYPSPCHISFKGKHWHSSRICRKHSKDIAWHGKLYWMEQRDHCIFLKNGSLSSPMARIENLLLFFTLIAHVQFTKVQVGLWQDNKWQGPTNIGLWSEYREIGKLFPRVKNSEWIVVTFK